MDLIPPQDHARLLANGRVRAAAIARDGDSLDPVPVRGDLYDRLDRLPSEILQSTLPLTGDLS